MTATVSQPRQRTEPFSPRLGPTAFQELSARVTVGEGEHETIEVEAPATGEILGTVPKCGPEDLEHATERARAVQRDWARTSFGERRELLLRYHDLILARQDEVLDVLQLESGKARRHGFEEIMDAAMVARYYAFTAERHLRSRRRRGAFPVLTQAWEHHYPIGLVGVISPWNYPLTLSISDAVPAIAAGNAVIIKTDIQTPYTALKVKCLLEEVGLPADVLQVVTGSGSELGPELIDRVDYMMFTGSTGVGRQVASQCGERLIPCSMELGGKNAMIVLPDANLERAAEGAERAMFSNGGQLCISMERLLVHESIASRFQDRLVARMQKMRLGGGLNYECDMGSLISQDQLDTVTEHVQDALEKGATLLSGGRARPDLGPYFYEPTLLTGVTEDMTLYGEETFGPVVALSTFKDEQEAIDIANGNRYGLNYSVWTRDTRNGRKVAMHLHAGTVNVNEGYIAAWGSVDAPMGGMKDSGLGRRHGAHGIQKYTEAQTVAVQRILPLAPPPMISSKLWAQLITAGLRLLRLVRFK